MAWPGQGKRPAIDVPVKSAVGCELGVMLQQGVHSIHI